MIFPAAKSRSYFDIVESFNDGSRALPAKLAAAFVILYDSASSKVRRDKLECEYWTNDLVKPQVLANCVYAETKEEAQLVMRLVLVLGPSYLNASVIPFNRLTADAGFGLVASLWANNQINDVYGMNLKKFNPATFMSVCENMDNYYKAF
jgi:hypothetical protein